jgi:hypothetical protein
MKLSRTWNTCIDLHVYAVEATAHTVVVLSTLLDTVVVMRLVVGRSGIPEQNREVEYHPSLGAARTR